MVTLLIICLHNAFSSYVLIVACYYSLSMLLFVINLNNTICLMRYRLICTLHCLSECMCNIFINNTTMIVKFCAHIIKPYAYVDFMNNATVMMKLIMSAISIQTDCYVQESIQEEVLFKFMMNKHNHRQWIAASDNAKQQQRLGLKSFKILGFRDLKIFNFKKF